MEEKNKDINITIGIPTSGYVHWEFAASIMGIQMVSGTRIVWLPRTMIDTARNALAEEALKNEKCTHLFMVDDDMTFEPDAMMKLLSRDVDVVGALAFKRRPDYDPCVYRKKEGKYFPILPNIFQEVDVVGSGGILIKTDVLKKLKRPWFETFYDDEGRHWSVDFDFCIKAKKAGFKIFVDPTVEMGHIGDAPVIHQTDFLRHVKQIGQQLEKDTSQ